MEKISPEFAAAIVQAQGNIEGAKKGRSNPAFRSKYADLAAVWDAIGDALQKAGLAIVQFPCEAPTGQVGLDTQLIYSKTGEVLGQRFFMPVKDATNAQAVGSSLTYARRYALSAVLGVCPEDDDGNAAASVQPSNKAPAFQSGPGEEEAIKLFSGAVTVDAKKKVYQAVKTSSIAEPKKTELLTQFGNVIKGIKN